MAMTFYRWTFALAFMSPFALPLVRRQWPLIRRHWRILLLLGVLGVGSHNALAYLGLNYTTATNGVILNSFIPVMIIALSRLFLGQRLSNLQLCGVAVSLAGVLTILAQGSLEQLIAFRLNPGDLFVIASMLLWSLYTICLRWRPARFEGHEEEPAVRELLDERNAAIIDAVNRTGEVFLSHTRLAGRFTIRVSVGGIRTEARHVERAWDLLRREAARLDGERPIDVRSSSRTASDRSGPTTPELRDPSGEPPPA